MADPEPSSGEAIELILGADVYANILREGLKRGPVGSPIAQKTTLGWILSRPTTYGTTSKITTITAHLANEGTSLQKQLRSFWKLEDIPKCSPLTEEELACEAHFAVTHKRLPEGRYSVKLPFKGVTSINIGSSSHTAEEWLEKLQRKFIRDSDLIVPYYDFMTEYILLQHMVPTTFNDSTPAVFLPYHPVIKDSSTTRLRVVFNASSKTSNGTSLNDHMMVGPKLQSDLPSIILRWRQHQFALTADITKMYRQILVDPEDQRYQQILWKLTAEAPATPYKLVTVTYDTASAPFLAMRVLKQLADDEKSKFPQAAPIVRDNFYVDDVLFGANDAAIASQLRKELEELLKQGGFTLRKWMSSHKSLLDNTSESDQEKTKIRSFDSTESVIILGIGWEPTSDSFCFNAIEPKRSKNMKRSVLSITVQLFDPLGWLSPVIVIAKIIMQELWIAALDWDDELPPEHSEKWNDYCKRIPELQAISVPRWNHLESNKTPCELHGFADASTRAYAAVVYSRTTNEKNEVKISLLTAKSIGPQLTDPSGFSALTPGHLLIGAPLLSIPEPTLLNLNENRLSRWQLVQQMLESFWKRWSVEYFHSLQVRTKWTKTGENITVGQLVLVRNNNLPPAKWMLGKITNVHPGSDSHVRVVTIRTAQSEFKRPISQICLLPVHTNADEPTNALTDEPPDTTDTSDFQDGETIDSTIISTTDKT